MSPPQAPQAPQSPLPAWEVLRANLNELDLSAPLPRTAAFFDYVAELDEEIGFAQYDIDKRRELELEKQHMKTVATRLAEDEKRTKARDKLIFKFMAKQKKAEEAEKKKRTLAARSSPATPPLKPKRKRFNPGAAFFFRKSSNGRKSPDACQITQSFPFFLTYHSLIQAAM